MPNFLTNIPWEATTAIAPATFVLGDGSVDFGVKQAGSGDWPIGIAQLGTLYAPNLPAAVGGTNPATPVAAPIGGELQVFLAGDYTEIVLGTGGCSAFSFLKPDTNGNAVATTTTGDLVGAQALHAGSAGERVACIVVRLKL